ncbi:Uncharacterised protein [Acinetobacter baumannii]|nr:Uncharacterised protein [Acinetobacter baumannii]
MLGHSLGPGGADVVLSQHGEHRVAHHQVGAGEAGDGEGGGGQYQVTRHVYHRRPALVVGPRSSGPENREDL